MAGQSLQIDRDLAYQRRQWIAERIGWSMMLLLVIAAAAGVFGEGMLSSASVSDRGELTVEYERFVRYLTPTTLKIHLPVRFEDKDVQIRINRDFLQAAKIESIVPSPATVVIGDNWLGYNFTVHGPGPVLIQFDLTHETAGRLSATISASDSAPLSFHQFVYP